MSNESAAIYFNYIRERQAIFDRRSAGLPAPWTQDPVLQAHHFCNNRREDDRVTKELRKAVTDTAMPWHALPAAYTLARMFNRYSTVSTALQLMARGANWVPAVKAMRERGELIFHVAYVVSTCGKSMDKVDYVDGVVNSVKLLDIKTGSLASVFQALRSVDGLGSFMAGQVVADLKNDPHYALHDAPDWFTWSCPGPGSKKGLEYIFDRAVTDKTYQFYMEMLQQALPEDIRAMKLHAQDLQNTLCEFSKYWRYINKLDGRRRVFNPRLQS